MKKESLLIVPLALLGTAFVVVSMLVVISGENSWLIRKKLKLGAMIISINAMALGTSGLMTGCPPPPPVALCYLVIKDYVCLLDEAKNCNYSEQILIPVNEMTTLEGRISYRSSEKFVFTISDSDDPEDLDSIIMHADVIIGNATDNNDEFFEITIDGSLLSPGEYRLRIHCGTFEELPCSVLASYSLLVE